MRLKPQTTSLTSIIEINKLSIAFPQAQGQKVVVDDLCLRIPQGKTVGLVGESGSGKSMTSLAIMQLLDKKAQITKGQILVHLKDNEKEDLLQVDELVLRKLRGNRISMIFQEPMSALNPVMKCGKQVAEILEIHADLHKKDLKRKVLEMMLAVQLPDVERIYKSYPHELSGGQKQRLMIAMAMANEPELLIADEPTTALDVSVQKTILDLIQALKKQFNTSVLFITHDLGLISDIADEVAVMYQGKLVESGMVDQVLNHPQHRYTKALMACRPPMDKRPRYLPSVSDFLEQSETPEMEYVGREERIKSHEVLYAKEPILKIDQLLVSYPIKKNFRGKVVKKFDAVRKVDFELYQGETLGLVGESGCGKTSLSRALLGLKDSESGHIWWKGQDILNFKGSEWRQFRQKMQIIFQDPYGSLNPSIPIGEAVMEPMQVHLKRSNTEAKKEALLLLEKTGISSDQFYKYPSEFSGGQRQRISIARALAMKPEIIICDESVSALDVSVQAQILNLLNQLKEEYLLSYLFISHDLSVVKYMSDRIMVMKDGKFEEIEEADQLYAAPNSDYTRMLISSIPGIKNP